MLSIGKLKLKSRLILSPMAGISDLPFRMLNRSFGSELSFIEMINARSMAFNSRKTREMLASSPEDRPLGVQLLGCEKGYILRALDILNKYDFDVLDFNLACPARKVVRRGEGAALMRNFGKTSELLKAIVSHSRWPVTVKIRAGWDHSCLNAPEIARLAEDSGVSAIFVHGRTRMQEYSGSVDYRVIAAVKKAVSIPVIANGDALSPVLIKKLFDESAVDAVGIARGSLGNPWIFRAAKRYLEHGELLLPPDINEVTRVMKLHLKLYADYYGERTAVVLFRKFFIWYTKGFRKVRSLREQASSAKILSEMESLIEQCRLKNYLKKALS